MGFGPGIAVNAAPGLKPLRERTPAFTGLKAGASTLDENSPNNERSRRFIFHYNGQHRLIAH